METKVELQPRVHRSLDVFFLSLTLLVCLIATLPQILVGDYKPHIAFAVEMAENNPIPVSHALFQKLILVLRTILPFRALLYQSDFLHYVFNHSFTICAILIAMAAYLATVIILKKRFYQNWKSDLGGKAYFYAWLASFFMLLVNPIILFTLGSNRLTLGYIPANVWHNPTYILMRPFALWLFFYIEDHWDKRLDAKQWFLVALISYLVVFAKPNFTLSMLPALGLLTLVKIRNIRHWNWGLLTAFMLPSLFSLTYQYWFMSRFPEISSYIFAPFLAALHYVENGFTLIAFILLSIAFSLTLTIFDFKETMRRVDFQLVWLNFMVALVTFLLFAEIPYVGSLNFSWGVMMAVFLLFAVSLNHLVRNYHRLSVQTWKTNLLLGLLALHLISGIVYTVLTIFYPGPVR